MLGLICSNPQEVMTSKFDYEMKVIAIGSLSLTVYVLSRPLRCLKCLVTLDVSTCTSKRPIPAEQAE